MIGQMTPASLPKNEAGSLLRDVRLMQELSQWFDTNDFERRADGIVCR